MVEEGVEDAFDVVAAYVADGAGDGGGEARVVEQVQPKMTLVPLDAMDVGDDGGSVGSAYYDVAAVEQAVGAHG